MSERHICTMQEVVDAVMKLDQYGLYHFKTVELPRIEAVLSPRKQAAQPQQQRSSDQLSELPVNAVSPYQR